MKPFNDLFHLLSTNLADKISGEVKAGLSPLAPYLRRLSIGVVFIMSSVIGWFTGLVFLLVSLFVYLANLADYVVPSLITSGVCFLVGILLLTIGLSFVRRPR